LENEPLSLICFRVFLLSKIGKVTVWEENRENSFIPCILSLSRSPPLLTDMALFRWNLFKKNICVADPSCAVDPDSFNLNPDPGFKVNPDTDPDPIRIRWF
jgi:hypothetical protein